MNSKLTIAAVLIILSAVIIFQNTAPVSFKMLFWSIEASLIILLLFVLLVGMIIGYIISKLYDKRGIKTKPE